MSDYTVFGAVGKIDSVSEFIGQVNSLQDSLDTTLQLFDASVIFGSDHLVSATNHALRSWGREEQLAKTLGMEILLYAAGDRQISLAVEKMGFSESTENFAGVVVGDVDIDQVLGKLELIRDDSTLDGKKDTARFGLLEEEIEMVGKDRVQDLVLERVALLDVRK